MRNRFSGKYAAARERPQSSSAGCGRERAAEEFKARHAKVFAQIGATAVAVVQGVAQTEGFTLPRQHNMFYYLSGIETPGAYLLLDGRTKQVTLYLPARNPRLEAAEGRVLSAEDVDLVKRISGADQVLPLQQMVETNWPLIAVGAPPAGGGRNQPSATIYAEFSPAENQGQSRSETHQITGCGRLNAALG